MNKCPSSLVWQVGLALFTMACSHSKDTPTPDAPTTAYQGSVLLATEFGSLVADKSGVTINVVDKPAIQATTDAAGNFALNIPQGTSRLRFTKPGYGTLLSPPVTVTTAPVVAAQAVTLGQTSSTYLTYFQGWIYDYVNHNYSLRGRINAPSYAPRQVRYHRLFLATSPGVSPNNYKATLLFSGSFPDPATAAWNLVADTVSRTTFSLVRVGASPTDKVYGVIYGDNPMADTYTDPASKLLIYPALNTQASEVFVCNP